MRADVMLVILLTGLLQPWPKVEPGNLGHPLRMPANRDSAQLRADLPGIDQSSPAGSIVLGCPTDTSITLSIFPTIDLDVSIEYGTCDTCFDHSSPTLRLDSARCIVGALLASVLVGCEKEVPGERPNIIVLVLDATRPDHLGCYGYSHPTSPNIDSLAATGLRFQNAITQAPGPKPRLQAC